MSNISLNLQNKITWCNTAIEEGRQTLRGEQPLNEKIKVIAKVAFAMIAKAFLNFAALFFPKKSEIILDQLQEDAEIEPYYNSEEATEESDEESQPLNIRPLLNAGTHGIRIVAAQRKRAVLSEVLSVLTPIETYIINPTNNFVTHAVAMPLLRKGTAQFTGLVATHIGMDLADPLSTKHFISVLQFTEKCSKFCGGQTTQAISKTVETVCAIVEAPRHLTSEGNQMAKDHMVAPLINQSKEYLTGLVQGSFLEHAVDPISNLGEQFAHSQVDNLHNHVNNKINDLEKPYRKMIVAATVDTVAQGVVSFAVGSGVSYCAYKLTEISITPILGSIASETIISYAPWVSTAVGIASIGLWVHSLQPVVEAIKDLNKGLGDLREAMG